VRIVTRAEWGARKPKSTPQRVAIGARTATCTHHDGANVITIRSFAEACARVRTDQNYHMDGNHWDDIGYNYLVISAPGVAGVDGLIFEGRGRDVVGAHCLNWNTPWVGIQVAIGGAQKPSPASLSSVRWLHDTFTTAAGHALGKKIHSDGFPTACPGSELAVWVHAGMPVGVAIPVKVAVITAVKAVWKAPAKVVAKITTRKLVVDGDFGPATKRRLQQWAGVTQDGELGPITWRAVQRKVGSLADGIPGPNTWKAIQRMVGATRDGVPGPNTYAALQRYLNSH